MRAALSDTAQCLYWYIGCNWNVLAQLHENGWIAALWSVDQILVKAVPKCYKIQMVSEECILSDLWNTSSMSISKGGHNYYASYWDILSVATFSIGFSWFQYNWNQMRIVNHWKYQNKYQIITDYGTMMKCFVDKVVNTWQIMSEYWYFDTWCQHLCMTTTSMSVDLACSGSNCMLLHTVPAMLISSSGCITFLNRHLKWQVIPCAAEKNMYMSG